jgi:hypothetical protein
MKVTINIIDHKEQRYDTCGDWQFTEDGLLITVSKLGDFYKEICVGIHELVEVVLCMKQGISQLAIDDFDTMYEAIRVEGDTSEPGDAPDAPYNKQHFVATTIERILAHELGLDWFAYENTINILPTIPNRTGL